jgi:glutamate carboxypeptidase
MLDQVTQWAAINSGSRHLAGLKRVAAQLADAFSALPGAVALEDAAPVEAMAADGALSPVAHGQNLHVTVRPEAPV